MMVIDQIRYIKKSFASPRKAKNPNTSVTVVKNIADASAGSTPKDWRVSGIKKPNMPATSKFSIIARKIITPK